MKSKIIINVLSPDKISMNEASLVVAKIINNIEVYIKKYGKDDNMVIRYGDNKYVGIRKTEAGAYVCSVFYDEQ